MLIKICWFLSIPILGVLLDSNATFSFMQIYFSISFLFYLTIQLGIKKSLIPAFIMGAMLDTYFLHPYLSNTLINLFVVLPIASLWLKHGDLKNIYLESLSLFLMSLIACLIKIVEADYHYLTQLDPYFTLLYLFCTTLSSSLLGLFTLSGLDWMAKKLHLIHFQTATIQRGL
jgi:cell shape-determining protein MreD